MAFKKVPVEMLLEIARFIRFHRRWAHVRVSHAFDQLLLESMADFLRHAQALVDPGIGLMYDWPNYYATKHIETILKKVGKIVHRLLRSDDTTVAHLNSMARGKCPTRR
uniref:F-box domain-containing protein n=1 Tax=Globodera pallida TaxID=36090 RepID=A0A183BP22_GLOPA